MNPPSPAQAMWLLARLRLQRLWNMIAFFRFSSAKKQKSRQATPGKRRVGWLLAALVGLAMLASVVNLSRSSILNAQCYLAPASLCIDANESRRGPRIDHEIAARELGQRPHFAPAVASALTMQLSLLFVLSILLPLSTREMAQADWDLEWLVTLPARRSTLLWGRIAERTLVNPTGWLFLTPSLAMIAWFSGFRWSAPLIGVAGALALLPLAAMVRTVADTGLRMWLPPSQLRNLQALATMLSMPLMYLAIGFASMGEGSPLLGLVRRFPEWAAWSAPGLLIGFVNGVAGWRGAALLLAQVALPVWLGMRLLRHQLRDGVVASGARESARSAAPPAQPGVWARLLPASPVKRRELRLLSRDRNFLIQSLLLPLIIFGSQLLFTGSPDAVQSILDSPRFLAATAFGIGSYMLMLSAFQTLNNEGQSLWILYTLPRSIEDVLKEKAEFWAVLALLYPLLMLGAGLVFAPEAAPAILNLFVVVLAGIPIFSVIAVSLGVFGCDPLAQDVRTKVKPSYVYLYMMLSGVYVYAVTSEAWAQKAVLIVLMAAFAVALWQKARDQLPYLLDPSMTPPARVSTADGLIAAMLFFVLQGVVMLALVGWAKMAATEAMVIAFGLAGIVVYCVMRLAFMLTKTRDVPAMLGGSASSALAWGAGGGAVAAVCGLVYLVGLQHIGWEPDAAMPRFDPRWLAALAVLAAPLCEEFIFRGLIFGGLRRSLGPLPSILMSAALFAIIHPPVSMAPVFALGVTTAYVYDRTRSLLAPVLVHAVYNAAVLHFQLGM
ncbi:MAG TPA: CPBP family intramembrane glutamic endopeptidase [Telluria sp.]|nr:CPBP family intramembrane glutamic endopeptidase [Telluria sp.]